MCHAKRAGEDQRRFSNLPPCGYLRIAELASIYSLLGKIYLK